MSNYPSQISTSPPLSGVDLVSDLNTAFTQLATTVSSRSSNTIIGAGDSRKLIVYTSGTFSQTFTAAATLGDGFVVFLRNNGSGVITLDPNASETIDGATTILLYPGQGCQVFCNGAALFTTKANNYPVGTATNDSAAAGNIGEMLESSVTATNVASASITSFATVPLTAGDWAIGATMNYNGGSGPAYFTMAIGATSGSFSGTTFGKDKIYVGLNGTLYLGSGSLFVPSIRLAGSASYYLNVQLNSNGPQSMDGYLWARRPR